MMAQVHESCTNCITSECVYKRYGIMDSVFSEEGSPRNFGRMKKHHAAASNISRCLEHHSNFLLDDDNNKKE